MAPCPRWKTTPRLYHTRKSHVTHLLSLCTAPGHREQFPRRTSHGESLSSLTIFYEIPRESAAFGSPFTKIAVRYIRRFPLASIK